MFAAWRLKLARWLLGTPKGSTLCANRTETVHDVDLFEVKFIVRRTWQPDGYSREELMEMQNLIWKHEEQQGWHVPLPDNLVEQLERRVFGGPESKKMSRTSYQQLIDEDIAWLEQQPRTLEREHVIHVVKASPAHEYDETLRYLLMALREKRRG